MGRNTHAALSELINSIDIFKNDVEEGLRGKKHKSARKKVLKLVNKIETNIEDYQYETDVTG